MTALLILIGSFITLLLCRVAYKCGYSDGEDVANYRMQSAYKRGIKAARDPHTL